jgi:acyl carrier protein
MSATKSLSEKEIIEIIQTILKRYINEQSLKMDISERFDKLGLDSLNSLLFISDIEEHFSDHNIEIDLPIMMQYPTPSSLAQYIYKNLKDK